MKKVKKIFWIFLLIFGIILIASGICFLLFFNDSNIDSKKKEDGKYHAYTCTLKPTSYTGPMNHTSYTTSYVENAKYHFVEFDSTIISGQYYLHYQFKNKKDYDQFNLGKNEIDGATEVLNEEDLEIDYSWFMIFPNMEGENEVTYTDSYLDQLKEKGFSCTLD